MQVRGGHKLLIPFLTAGYPSPAQTERLVLEAEQSGADIIELGMPFSDPLADGPAIQYSSHIALQHGTTLQKILHSVSQLRSNTQVPLVLMGYYNPIFAFGTRKFLKECSHAGVDGLIIPDLPVEEAAEFVRLMTSCDLTAIFLAAPTTSTQRLKTIERLSTDFVYAVTVTGVTGARRKFDQDTEAYLRSLHQRLGKPFVAGFGVSTPETARSFTRYADGVVIGSALVELIRSSDNQRQQIKNIGRFLAGVRKALDRR